MLRIENLRAGDLPPLSFKLSDGECLAVEGPSGAGKSRLLRAIADLDAASGHVFLDGAERREMAGYAWRALVRYVSAEPAWWTETARQTFPPTTSPDRIRRLSDALGLDAATLDSPLSQTSTGERQRMALVRALADEPRVLLLDEPTAALDAGTAALVEELIRYQLLSGRLVMLVSHDAAMIERLASVRLELAPSRPLPHGRNAAPGGVDAGRAA